MKYHLLLFAILLYIFLIFKSLIVILLMMLIVYFKYKDYSFLCVLSFLIFFIQLPESVYQNEGYVIDVNSNSYIISYKGNNTLLITDENLNYDDYIIFTGDVNKNEEFYSSFGFNFYEYYQNSNVKYQVFADDITLVSEGNSLRNKLFSYLNTIENDILKDLYLKFLFNYNSDNLNDVLLKSGYQFNGLLLFLTFIFSFFLSDNNINIINVFVLIVFVLILGFNLVLYRLLLARILKVFNINKYDRFALNLILLLIVFPTQVLSLSVVFPFCFGIISLFYYEKGKSIGILTSMLIQSLYYFEFNLLISIFYRSLIKIYGLIFCVLLIFIFNVELLQSYINIIVVFFQFIEDFSIIINGKVNIFVIIILLIIYSINKSFITCIFAFIAIMYFNLFNPFTTVHFINVGQGDSVLLLDRFNFEVILYDTGKESSFIYLNAFLKAYGIDTIDYLIISHNDNDHSGNVANLYKDYNIKNLIVTHQNIDSKFKLYSLNNNIYDNDNDNSLVYLFNVNNLNFLLTGDISKVVEEKLIDKYNNLKVDILKVAHHGSMTSTSSNFIQTIKPSIGIISAGNKYNHPHYSVVNTLINNNVYIIDTKKDGDISFFMTKYLNFIKTTNNQIILLE